MNQNHFKELEMEMSKYGVTKIDNTPNGVKVYEFYHKEYQRINHETCPFCDTFNYPPSKENMNGLPVVCIIQKEKSFQVRRYCRGCNDYYPVIRNIDTLEEVIALFAQTYKWYAKEIDVVHIYFENETLLKYPFHKMLTLLEGLK